VGHVVHMEGMKNAYSNFVGKPEGKRPLGRPLLSWKEAIRMELKETGGGNLWTGLIWLTMGTSDGLS